MQRFDRYIEKCFKDAAESNERTLTSKNYEFRYYIFNNNMIALVLNCEYASILKQASRRIEKNFKNNFGLEMTTVIEYDANQQSFDPNYCVCEMTSL